jgi:hypothetical protein
VIQNDFIRLRDDGKFVWVSSDGIEWTSEQLSQATIKRTLTLADEAAVDAVVDQLNRLQRTRPKIHSFV